MTMIEMFEKGLIPVNPGNPYFEGLINYKKRNLALHHLDRRKGLCKWCWGKPTPSARQFYCSRYCQVSAEIYCNPQGESSRIYLDWKQKGLCVRCSSDAERGEIDHIKPIYQGGPSIGFDNLQLLCHECHKIKTAEDRKNV